MYWWSKGENMLVTALKRGMIWDPEQIITEPDPRSLKVTDLSRSWSENLITTLADKRIVHIKCASCQKYTRTNPIFKTHPKNSLKSMSIQSCKYVRYRRCIYSLSKRLEGNKKRSEFMIVMLEKRCPKKRRKLTYNANQLIHKDSLFH